MASVVWGRATVRPRELGVKLRSLTSGQISPQGRRQGQWPQSGSGSESTPAQTQFSSAEGRHNLIRIPRTRHRCHFRSAGQGRL